MTNRNDVVFMKYFIEVSECTPEKTVLLLLDDHSSHILRNLIYMCRGNGITSLTCPPHCSHELQPLDRSVWGSFKNISVQDVMGG